MNEKRPLYKVLLLAAVQGVLLGIGVLIVFMLGFAANDFLEQARAQGADFGLLTEVTSLLKGNYVHDMPEDKQLEYGAVRGMVGTLDDPYTFFIEPQVAKSESDALAGQYGGIGVDIQRDPDLNFLLFPYPESPAEGAGIRGGDVLVAVNGEAITLDMPVDTVRQLLRGRVDTGESVTVTVRHDDGTEETFTIAFAVIKVPSVMWRVLEDTSPALGYVHVMSFTGRTHEELVEALNDLRGAGIAGLVLDLRDDAGGSLDSSIDVAGEFLSGGVVVYEITREGEIVHEASEGGNFLRGPLVVLVNHGTASASELVAGALQDRGRAILIGQRTYGKGSIQMIFTLSDGSSLHLTSAAWFTPDRHAIDGVGLEPNIAIQPADYDVALEEAVRYLDGLLTSE